MKKQTGAVKHGVVKIKTPGEKAAGFRSTFTQESGEPLHGIRSATITIRPDEVIAAQIDLCCSFEGGAVPHFWITDPYSGSRKHVEQVCFADGSLWAAGDPVKCIYCAEIATEWVHGVTEIDSDGPDRCFVKSVQMVCAAHAAPRES